MTAQEVINRARDLTNDTDTANPRINNTSMLYWINDGMRLIWDIRSDSRLAANGTRITFAEATDVTDTLCLLDRFRGALSDYVCYRAFTMESGSTENIQRATFHMQSFTTHLMPEKN